MPTQHYDDDHTVLMPPMTGDGRSGVARPGLTQVSSQGGDRRISGMFLGNPRPHPALRFDSVTGLNPLLEAASTLLSEIVSLRFETQVVDLNSLRERLESEVRSFEVKALASEVEQAQVLAARYLLCTAVDEAINTSALGKENAWSPHTLLSSFHNETAGGEKFFLVLEKCLAQPTRSLYLLELMYIIISLGFEGRHKVIERGNISLEALRDKLYREIRLLRGDPLTELAPPLPRRHEESPPRYLSTWLVAFVAAFCLMGTFFAFSFILNQRTDEVLGRYAVQPIEAPSQTPQEQYNAGNV